MYFWNDKKLAQDLKKGIVTEKEQMLYLLVLTFLTSIYFTLTFGQLIFSSIGEISIYDRISDVLYIIISAYTVILCFQINQSGDGRDYVTRYICLGLPISIKGLVFAIILGGLSGTFDPDLQNIETIENSEDLDLNPQHGIASAASVVLTSLFVLALYIRSFKIMNKDTQ